jgi:hypothetical protein
MKTKTIHQQALKTKINQQQLAAIANIRRKFRAAMLMFNFLYCKMSGGVCRLCRPSPLNGFEILPVISTANILVMHKKNTSPLRVHFMQKL